MNAKDSEATYVYRTDDLTVQQWRDVMRACQAYEKFLLDGQKLSPEDFAFRYAEIPTHLLIPELIKIHSELLEHPASRSLDCESTPSPSDRYLILEEIRSGGMGQVFRAFDRACGRLVAIKRIRKELAQEPLIRQRFLAEVELTADLEHPGVIPIYNQSVDSSGREFYVMRLIHGEGTGTLQQAIQHFHSATSDGTPSSFTRNSIRNWNPSKRAAFRKLIESVLVIVDTTAHAHSRGIAHRDLKPSNVLVGPFGETLIADWGLAKRINLPEPSEPNLENNDLNLLQSNLPKDNQSNWSLKSYGVGTPGFRAPETQSGSATTNLIAADIYSLGAILECVISGVARHTNDASFRKIKTPGPTAILPLMAIARKAMSGEVANRYPNAQSMGRDLSNWLAGEPVSAYPESLAERVWRWPSRHRMAASAIASALLIALTGFAWFSWFQKTQNAKLSRALNTATALLEENQRARQSIEEASAQRETLALHAIIEFQSLLTSNPALQSDLQFRSVRERILKESRNFYESLAKSFDLSEKNDSSLARISDAAIALILLENELGNFSDAIQTAESACQRLQKQGMQSQQLNFHLGRILAFKGNIQTRHGWKKLGQDDQQKAVSLLEPILDSNELTASDRDKAFRQWSQAASPVAIGLAAQGDFESAGDLLLRIIARINVRNSQGFEDSLLKIQSYGNLAMVRYFSKDTQGTYEALDQAELSAARCENLIDGSVPLREKVEFEVLRSTLVRFKSDLMLTEGKIDPAIEMQSNSLTQLTNAVTKHPGNIDLQNAYVQCINRLKAVLLEHGRIARANEVSQAWLELAQKIERIDSSNPNTQEFLLLAHHTLGHLSETNQQLAQAQQSYSEALSIAKRVLAGTPQSDRLLAQALELSVHLIRLELISDRFESAQSHFEETIEYASTMKNLPVKNDQYQSSINLQVQAALRNLQDSVHKDKKDQWIRRLKDAELLTNNE